MSGEVRVFDYQGNSEKHIADSARVEGGILYLEKGTAVTIVNADAWSKAVAVGVNDLRGGYI
ncbi:Uncharacterised protein [Mycobacteroides abscessus subsp. abscessus]|nr:Uncharacterised protein [Mycobacteroides abscessus subsp. abscessus]SHW68438.1 Uncharacterised protein [Mycobacteroides abscessus subsp. abscessus]SHY70017.1 Uncharacterised protein [Mycobacteroides abscessus subsp. abscessus]SHZ45235.1 Uncharacterised protein [Mycobacteroides abscessus subsp. abscessus]SKR90599.1 Uncharacterised protein [Mycobacteroides abscessus subsp. abscessus]